MPSTVSGTIPLVPSPARIDDLPGAFVPDARFDHDHADLRRRLLGDSPTRIGRAATADAPRLGPGLAEPSRRLRWIDARPDHSVHPEAYDLRVEASGVTVQAELPGARHALATLGQVLVWARAATPGVVPGLRVRDEPVFGTRAVLLDVSRNKVPTMECLRGVIDTLAALKFNHLQLYTEHVFAYAGTPGGPPHEEVWRGTGAITPDQARELDAHAASRGIVLAANQNCFGHLSAWLRHPAYAHLAEIEGPDREWTFMHWPRQGPFSLCPTEPARDAALAFVRDLLSQLTPCFRSPLVNINADETFDVGQGRSRAWVAARAAELLRSGAARSTEHAERLAKGELYYAFVGSIARIVSDLGKTPMLWADGALAHPELIDRLPRDAVPLIWGYEPETDFASGLSLLAQAGRSNAWVCPGTGAWRSITGRTAESRANIRRAAREGHGHAAGFMVCEWGDVGHTQHWPVTLARLADAAQAAWRGVDASDEAHAGPIADPRAVSIHLLDDPTGRLADWINDLGDVDHPLRTEAFATYAPLAGTPPDPRRLRPGIKNASAMFNDLFPPVPPPNAPPFGPGTRAVSAPRAAWLQARDRLEALAASRPESSDALLNAELEHTLVLASFALEHAIAHRPDSADAFVPGAESIPTASVPSAERRRLAEHARRWLREHRRLWPARNRPGEHGKGLDESCSHMIRVIAALEAGL